MTLAILYREEIKEYDFGPGHPFRGDRYEIFPRFLRENLPQDDNYRIIRSGWATDEDLSLICEPEYIDFTKNFYRLANAGLSYDGRFHRFHSADNMPRGKPGKLEEAARLIIGQAKLAVDLVGQGKFQKVVSLGGGMHHAKPSYGEGFCIYNDMAFAGKYLIEEHKLEKVLILDTDAHAGNGTCEYFYEESRVLFIDLHEHPRYLYPCTGYVHEIGSGKGRGFTVNCPLLPGTGRDSYQYIFDQVIFPLTEEFKPQIILRNGGSDPYWDDQLTHLGLAVGDFRKIGENVRKLAKICDRKVIDMIGSGYNKEALPHAWFALICGLADIKVKIEERFSAPQKIRKDPRYEDTHDMVRELKKNLKDYWRCFSE